MGKRGALSYTKKGRKGAEICQKEAGPRDSVPMNSSNTWCKIGSFVCCLLLGYEGISFVHDLATQARSLKSSSITVENKPLAHGQEIARNS